MNKRRRELNKKKREREDIRGRWKKIIKEIEQEQNVEQEPAREEEKEVEEEVREREGREVKEKEENRSGTGERGD